MERAELQQTASILKEQAIKIKGALCIGDEKVLISSRMVTEIMNTYDTMQPGNYSLSTVGHCVGACDALIRVYEEVSEDHEFLATKGQRDSVGHNGKLWVAEECCNRLWYCISEGSIYLYEMNCKKVSEMFFRFS